MSSNNRKNEKNLMTRVSVAVIIILALIQAIGEEVVIPVIFIGIIVLSYVFAINIKKQNLNKETALHHSKPEKQIEEHSHNRLSGFDESTHTSDDHWKSQADAFLKAGLITKKEHAEMIQRRVSQEQAAYKQ